MFSDLYVRTPNADIQVFSEDERTPRYTLLKDIGNCNHSIWERIPCPGHNDQLVNWHLNRSQTKQRFMERGKEIHFPIS